MQTIVNSWYFSVSYTPLVWPLSVYVGVCCLYNFLSIAIHTWIHCVNAKYILIFHMHCLSVNRVTWLCYHVNISSSSILEEFDNSIGLYINRTLVKSSGKHFRKGHLLSVFNSNKVLKQYPTYGNLFLRTLLL